MCKLATVFLVLIFCMGTMSYQGYRSFPEPQPTTEGQLIYQEMGCPMCHGHQGMGDGFLAEGLDPKPRNFTSYEEMLRLPYQRMYEAIKSGIPSSGMPAFKLSDKQIDDTISYVRTFLTENYLTLSTCVNTPQVINLYDSDINGKFKVEVEQEKFVLTTLKAGELTLIPNTTALMKEFRKKRKHLTRIHINLIKGEGDDKTYEAIIALRIKDCFK